MCLLLWSNWNMETNAGQFLSKYQTLWCSIAVPRARGEGALLMVADFVSANYCWLTSADGAQLSQVLSKGEKQCKGYFTNKDILDHVTSAMDILNKDYAHKDHVFVFNNTTTYLKWEENALSATKMPKNTPPNGTNWDSEVNELAKTVSQFTTQMVKYSRCRLT